MHSHMQSLQMVISHPSSLLEASQNGCTMLQAACWRELYHGSGNMDQILAKKRGLQCRLYIQVWGFKQLETWNQIYTWDLFVSMISFAMVFLPLDSLPILFHKFPLHWKYLMHILIFQLFHLVHGTSLYQFPIDFEVVSAPTGAGKWSTRFYESSRLVGRELQSRNPEDCAVWVSHFGNARTLIRPMNLIWKDAIQHKHVSGVISNRCVLKVWSLNIIMLTARKQQIIGIGWNFLAQAAFAFFRTDGSSCFKQFGHTKKHRPLLGVRMSFTRGWPLDGSMASLNKYNGVYYQAISGVWITHTYAPCTLVISHI